MPSNNLPRYHTSDARTFQKRWEENPSGTWLATKLYHVEDVGLSPSNISVVLVGPYRAAYEETLRRMPVNSAMQGFLLEPVDIVQLEG